MAFGQIRADALSLRPAELIVSLDADFLGLWAFQPLRRPATFRKRRQPGDPGRR